MGFSEIRLVGRRIRHGWRLYVVVDSRCAQQSAVASLVHRNARLGSDVGYSLPHAVVLDSAPDAVIGQGAVLKGDAATVGEHMRIHLP